MLRHRRAVTCITVEWTSRQAVSCSNDRTAFLWDLNLGEVLRTFAKGLPACSLSSSLHFVTIMGTMHAVSPRNSEV
eukprot:2378578-Amphidinium_carterae.1